MIPLDSSDPMRAQINTRGDFEKLKTDSVEELSDSTLLLPWVLMMRTQEEELWILRRTLSDSDAVNARRSANEAVAET